MQFIVNLENKFNYNERCKKCYETRLFETAKQAANNGFEAFSTTLLISPFQQHEQIKLIAEKFAEQFNVKFLYEDFRPNFRIGQQKARQLGQYMQKYCGCIFSEEERFLNKLNK